MNAAQKILFFMGVAYVILGGFGTFISLAFDAGFFAFIPALFLILGIAFIAVPRYLVFRKNEIVRKGRKYTGKIYGYIENTSYTVNGAFTLNTKVRYFDENHIEREAIIPTSFSKGSDEYPIGMTIDIYEYNNKFGFDKKSVRYEVIYGEEELMDDKPIQPDLRKLVAVRCPGCSATFQAVAGYSNKCPYCGGYYNAR
ncbi:MAG: hypothetical protein Q4C42_03500 [Clostridia bacterium]|nr:hypothetical protein [Clostridia bacterium]